MEKDTRPAQFAELRDKIKRQWSRLTDEDIAQMEGRAEILACKLQEWYGLDSDEANRQAREFRKRTNWS